MSNTLGTTNATVIAQKALIALQGQLPILKNVATDVSAEGAKFGETVIVHEVAAAAAVAFNPATGYVPAARTQVDIPVALNQHIHHTYAVGVQEASTSRVDLINRFALNAAYSLGTAIVQALCGLVTKANFPTESVFALGAGGDGFSRKQAILLNKALSLRAVAPFGRFALLNSDYFASLAMDSTLMNLIMLRAGANAVETGILPPVHGIEFSEFIDLPVNGQNLVGFCSGRTALAFAARLPDDPGEGSSNCAITTATDDQTGLSLQVREWYNADMGEFRRTYTLMFGVAKGQSAALQRIVAVANP